MKHLKSAHGFSMIELLLVAALFPLIAFAVFSLFNAGAGLWEVLHRDSHQEEAAVFFETVNPDFYNLFKYTGLNFSGNPEELEFITRIDTDSSLGGERGIGQVHYFYDEGKHVLFREQRNLSEVYQDKTLTPVRAMLSHLNSFQISYFYKDKKEGVFKWQEAWEGDVKTLPVAVRFSIEFSGDAEPKNFNKTFMIPTGTRSS